jgi:hypothetical protein
VIEIATPPGLAAEQKRVAGTGLRGPANLFGKLRRPNESRGRVCARPATMLSIAVHMG